MLHFWKVESSREEARKKSWLEKWIIIATLRVEKWLKLMLIIINALCIMTHYHYHWMKGLPLKCKRREN